MFLECFKKKNLTYTLGAILNQTYAPLMIVALFFSKISSAFAQDDDLLNARWQVMAPLILEDRYTHCSSQLSTEAASVHAAKEKLTALGVRLREHFTSHGGLRNRLIERAAQGSMTPYRDSTASHSPDWLATNLIKLFHNPTEDMKPFLDEAVNIMSSIDPSFSRRRALTSAIILSSLIAGISAHVIYWLDSDFFADHPRAKVLFALPLVCLSLIVKFRSMASRSLKLTSAMTQYTEAWNAFLNEALQDLGSTEEIISAIHEPRRIDQPAVDAVDTEEEAQQPSSSAQAAEPPHSAHH